MVSLPRPVTCFKGNLTSLTKLHLYPVFSFHFLRRSAELVFEGILLICQYLKAHFVYVVCFAIEIGMWLATTGS